MVVKVKHKKTIMWNLTKRHKVEICDFKGNILKKMWLKPDGSNRSKIDAEIERLQK